LRTAGENESVYCDRFSLASLNYSTFDSEAASESLPIAEALRMLRMSSADELRDWAKSRDREWDVDVKSGVVRLREEHKTDIEVCWISTTFKTLHPVSNFLLCTHTLCRFRKHTHSMSFISLRLGTDTSHELTSIMLTVQMPSQKLIIETLSYAKELERIV
jgi:hypothetical protein